MLRAIFLSLLLLSGAALAAKPSADPRATAVIVIQPLDAPGSMLSIEGKAVGLLKPRHALRFQLPAGKSARLRAGRGGDTAAGHWPVFYADIAASPGRTVHLVLDLTFGKISSVHTLYTGTGHLSMPGEARLVTRGAFRKVSAAEAQKLMAGLKTTEKGEVKLR